MDLEEQDQVIQQVEQKTEPLEVGKKVVEEDKQVQTLEELGSLMIYFGGTGFRRMDEISSYLSKKSQEPNTPVVNQPMNVDEEDFLRAYNEKKKLGKAFEEIHYALEDFEKLMSRETPEEERKEIWEDRIPEGEEIDVLGFRELYEDVKRLYEENLLPDLLAFETQLKKWKENDMLPDQKIDEETYRNFTDESDYDKSKAYELINTEKVKQKANEVIKTVYSQKEDQKGFSLDY